MAAMCGAVLLSEDPGLLGTPILRCDLVEHSLALNKHYDKLHRTEWRKDHNEPAAVLYSPTGPLKKIGTGV